MNLISRIQNNLWNLWKFSGMKKPMYDTVIIIKIHWTFTSVKYFIFTILVLLVLLNDTVIISNVANIMIITMYRYCLVHKKLCDMLMNIHEYFVWCIVLFAWAVSVADVQRWFQAIMQKPFYYCKLRLWLRVVRFTIFKWQQVEAKYTFIYITIMIIC